MTSEEFRTNPLLLRNQFEGNGTFEIPVIQKEKVSLENLTLIGYDKINSGKENQIVHFFLDDYKFEVLWNNPEPRIERLSADFAGWQTGLGLHERWHHSKLWYQ